MKKKTNSNSALSQIIFGRDDQMLTADVVNIIEQPDAGRRIGQAKVRGEHKLLPLSDMTGEVATVYQSIGNSDVWYTDDAAAMDQPAADPSVSDLLTAAFEKAFRVRDGRDDNRGSFEECERLVRELYSIVANKFKLAASIADLKTAAIEFNGSLERHSAAQAELSRYMRGGDLHDPKLLGVPSGSDYAAAIESARFAKDEMDSAAAFIRSAFDRETLEHAVYLANNGQFPEFNAAILKFAPLS